MVLLRRMPVGPVGAQNGDFPRGRSILAELFVETGRWARDGTRIASYEYQFEPVSVVGYAAGSLGKLGRKIFDAAFRPCSTRLRDGFSPY